MSGASGDGRFERSGWSIALNGNDVRADVCNVPHRDPLAECPRGLGESSRLYARPPGGLGDRDEGKYLADAQVASFGKGGSGFGQGRGVGHARSCSGLTAGFVGSRSFSDRCGLA